MNEWVIPRAPTRLVPIPQQVESSGGIQVPQRIFLLQMKLPLFVILPPPSTWSNSIFDMNCGQALPRNSIRIEHQIKFKSNQLSPPCDKGASFKIHVICDTSRFVTHASLRVRQSWKCSEVISRFRDFHSLIPSTSTPPYSSSTFNVSFLRVVLRFGAVK